MTTGGKVALIGVGTALAGAAAYFLLGKKSQTNVLLPASTSQGSSSGSSSPTNQPAAQPANAPAVQQSPYEGKVIRADQEPAVYLIKDGIRHGFLSPDALHRAGFDFPQVISVPKAIVQAIPEGSHISGLSGFSKRLVG